MRKPDRFTDEPGIAADGGHIPATLYHLDMLHRNDADSDDVLGKIASRLSSLVPVQEVRAVRDNVRQLFSLQLTELSGVSLRANSISDGTLRFLALTAIAESTEASGLYCMEEPENGIHPAKLPDMHQLLCDIAVDPAETVAADNPLRQVIVATHSPYFVQLQNRNDLVLAKNPAMKSGSGRTIWPLRCYPMQGSWRERGVQDNGTEAQGVGMLELYSYLVPPEGSQLKFPPDFWQAIC